MENDHREDVNESAKRTQPNVEAPFDGVAYRYDRDFSHHPIGIRKRTIVRRYVEPLLRSTWDVLELNCGTGEDALWIAPNVRSLTSTDISAEMVRVASEKFDRFARSRDLDDSPARRNNVRFCRMPIEALWQSGINATGQTAAERTELDPLDRQYNLIFSDFDGFNCVNDLPALVRGLAEHLEPGGEVIAIFMSDHCAVEMLHRRVTSLIGRGKPGGSISRKSGEEIHIGDGRGVTTYFHPIRELIARFLEAGFSLRSMRGIGLVTPPTRLRDFYQRNLRLFQALEPIEDLLSPLPPFSRYADHVLVHFRMK